MDELERFNIKNYSRNIEYKRKSHRTRRIILLTLFAIIIVAVGLAIGLRYRRSKIPASNETVPEKETTTTQPPSTIEDDGDFTGIGLALCGGVYPGGVVAGGIVRGFQRKRIKLNDEEKPALDAFDYIAALSGGNLATIVYAFAPTTSSNILLDAQSNGNPSLITTREMENIPRSSIFSRFNIPAANHMFLAMSGGNTQQDSKVDVWENFVYDMFLKPFGIADQAQPIGKIRNEVKAIPLAMTTMLGPSELYHEYSSENHVNRKFQTAISFQANKFGKIFKNLIGTKPLLTLPENNADLWDAAKISQFQIPYGAFITPNEFEIPILEHRTKYDSIGNKSAESIDFVPISAHPDSLQPRGEGKFSLSKMLAVSTNTISFQIGAIPSSMKAKFSPSIIEIPTKSGEKRKVVLTDGGYNSINGVAALVKKKVRKIVCNLFSTQDRIKLYRDNGYDYPWMVGYVHILKFFGVVFQDLSTDYKSFDYAQTYTLHFFDLYSNGENQVNKFVESIKSLYRAGEPMIVTLKDLDVVENRFWGIEAGGKVDLTVIVNAGVPRKFADQVPLNVVRPPRRGTGVLDEYGYFRNEKYNTVPNLLHETGDAVVNIPEAGLINQTLDGIPEIALTTENIQMTKLLCSWMIEHAWEELVGDDGEVKFEGFKRLLSTEENS